MAIIIFNIFQEGNNKSIALSGGPNHSVSNTIIDILLFIPGVTASLVVFLVFGTTKSWRQYRDLVVGGCGIRTKIYERRIQRAEEGRDGGGLEFERLPSLPNRAEEDEGIKAERRVRMFVTNLEPEPQAAAMADVTAAEPSAESSNHAKEEREQSRPANLEFHKPRFVDMALSVQPSPLPNSPIDTTASQDRVKQYGVLDEERTVEANGESQDERRFVTERPPKNDRKRVLGDSSD